MPWARSLRIRLLGATLITLSLALAGAHVWLSGLFRDHVVRQFDVALVQQLDQLTARLAFDARGQPTIDPRSLSDPRWDKPYSGLYWQLDTMGTQAQTRTGVLRSRSLWDGQLQLSADALANQASHAHDAIGPRGEALRVLERALSTEDRPLTQWRLMVAADTQELQAAVDRFSGVLAASLAGLGVLLAMAALAQVSVGLAPLKTLQRALERLRTGNATRLDGEFPAEVQPLINDFNSVLARNQEVVERARTQAGNLAHALKTPLAVLANAAHQDGPAPLARLVAEQVQEAQRHIQWHLARASAAASQQLPGQRTPVQPVLEGLLRVMGKVHAERGIRLDTQVSALDVAFAGEAQDLQEMLGNLLDNACRNARSTVRVAVQSAGRDVTIAVDDDGNGVPAEQRDSVLKRGVRLDESQPGSGLGLAIVLELAGLYGGQLALGTSDLGGLQARLTLPAFDATFRSD